MATSPDRGGEEQAGSSGSGQHAADTVRQPADAPPADGLAQPSDGPVLPGDGEPDVLSPRGKYLVKLNDWTTRAFDLTLGEGGDAKPVTLTAAGLQVTKAESEQLQQAAAAHGVAVSVEEISK